MQKITTANYYNIIKDIDWNNLPKSFKEGHELVEGLHSQGTHDFQLYSLDADIKSVVEEYFTRLALYLHDMQQPKKMPAPQAAKPAMPSKSQTGKKTVRQSVPVTKPAKTKVPKDDEDGVRYGERIPDEIRFIKRYINLNGKVKSKEDILRFISTLQKSILERRIRKSSEYAPEIEKIQKDLVATFNSMKSRATYVISEAAVKKYREKTNSEKIYLSIRYLNRYRNLIGKPGVKKKAEQLLKQMKKAAETKKILKTDPHITPLEKAYKMLYEFTKDKTQKTLTVGQQELNGLDGILGCACPPSTDGLDGFDEITDDRPQIMNSLDFVNLKFDTLGFTGKWREFIGDPSGNFTAMVFGKPKLGKSFLCVDFAGYLARYHGTVLYVAKEETLDLTLQEKLKDKNVAHENLTVASVLPTDIAPYDFIFLDSVNKLGYTPQDLDRLKTLHPGKSFVFVFQTTKAGNFRGENTFQHDVDVVIEVPEPGFATQMGRFNQGGTMKIFE